MANTAQFIATGRPKKVVSIESNISTDDPGTSGSIVPASNQYAGFMWSVRESVAGTDTITIDFGAATVVNAVRKDRYCMEIDGGPPTVGPQLFIAPIGETLSWSVSASQAGEFAIEFLFEDA